AAGEVYRIARVRIPQEGVLRVKSVEVRSAVSARVWKQCLPRSRPPIDLDGHRPVILCEDGVRRHSFDGYHHGRTRHMNKRTLLRPCTRNTSKDSHECNEMAHGQASPQA